MGFETVTDSDGTQRECFVAYGLGDFYTDPAQENGKTSLILNLTFSKNSDGSVSISEAGYIPIYQYITETAGKKHFEVLDVYDSLATLARTEELSSTQATLYNSLLDVIDTLHTYAGEDLDAGLQDADLRVVQQAIEAGEISQTKIDELEQAEQEAAEKAKAAIAQAVSENGEDVDDGEEEANPEEE
jgi:hypothetical protein